MKWSRPRLRKMLLHNYASTIADNSIEIGWILCFSLLADKHAVERITTMFGLNDAMWVVLSSTYYAAKNAMMAILPKIIAEKGVEFESQQFKTVIYSFYILLIPLALGTMLYMPKLLLFLGVNKNDFNLYLPYFYMTVVSILFFAPWSLMITSYLRARGQTKIAMVLDHAVSWSMIIGVFITTHIFHLGVLWAMVVNMVTNAIPLYWFIWKKPINKFWSKGFEFSISELKRYWSLIKWELFHRLAPRLSFLFSSGIILQYNPIILAAKYWIDNSYMFITGWVESEAGLINTHMSRNVGLKITKPERDNNFIYINSIIGVVISTIVLYFGIFFLLRFLPIRIYQELINPWIYVCLVIGTISSMRYFSWLAIGRTVRQDLYGIAQIIYVLPVIFLQIPLLYLFLNKYHLGFFGIALTTMLMRLIQLLMGEIWFQYKLRWTPSPVLNKEVG